MGTLFMVNPPTRKKKRRTAAQKRATKKMLEANKKRRATKKRRRSATKITTRRKRTEGATMARKRTKKRATTTRRRRRSTAKRRSPVTTLRRHSVYATNPRRKRGKRRRSRVHRNPAIFATLKQGAMDAGATLVGGAVARMANGLLPLPKDGVAGVASSLAVALGVGLAARRVVSHDTARFITAGAMQVPIKNLITTFVPQAGAFLGDYDSVGAYALPTPGVGDYMNPGMYGHGDEVEIGVYE